MVAWWETLSTLERILACIAFPATLILVIQTVMLLFGFGDGPGADADADADFDLDLDLDGDDLIDIHDGDYSGMADGGLRLFTVRGFVAFFTVFGWGGLALTKSGASATAAIIVGVIFGLCSMLVMAIILRFALKLQSDGTLDFKNALGASGSVYIPIPPGREEKGKVTVVIQERLCECDAVTDEEKRLQTGTPVVVTGITGKNTLVVRRKQ